jgi:hypothetical protein
MKVYIETRMAGFHKEYKYLMNVKGDCTHTHSKDRNDAAIKAFYILH